MEALGKLVAGDDEERPTARLLVDRDPGGVDAGIAQVNLVQAVVGRRLAVEMVAVLERDRGVVADDLVLAGDLAEQDVLQRDPRQLLKAGASLDGAVDLVLALVDEDVDRAVNRMIVGHGALSF